MAVIKITDIAYGRLRAPDLDVMEEFLTHFGLVKVERTNNVLYMRGSGAAHHIHITEKGDPKFVGAAFYARNLDDLKKLTRLPGASGIETMDEPGGGKRVRLKEPNGFQIEVVHGIKNLKQLNVKRDPTNSGEEPLRRAGKLMRPSKGPTPVKKIGHCVMASPKVKETIRWFRDTLGLIRSDDLYVGTRDNVIGSFNRADRGNIYVDHHVFFCMNQGPVAGLNHFSFEVPDIDAVFVDHQYLTGLNKYEHMWGVGRHLLGSQVYDYWADPWGRVHEHWADSDRLNVKSGSHFWTPEEGLVSQWGEAPPEKLMHRVCP